MAEIAKKFLITTQTVEIIRIRSNCRWGERIHYADTPDEIHISELELKTDRTTRPTVKARRLIGSKIGPQNDLGYGQSF
ncbi:hypothetical protein [Leptolyngbya sp. 7M]|uniref:hypothetical protein n=1 Tax=Leptolyngbya sp. 7M TaxID=2812896 RepID=UPI001B8BBAAD|nr:hypothetical protein [Leptolyngbya sp. 7M]QYO66045.1 hypothetical protein JVX88_04385 [Leptolyngbya sp. 7M]